MVWCASLIFTSHSQNSVTWHYQTGWEAGKWCLYSSDWVSPAGILWHWERRRTDCCCLVAKSCLTLCGPMDCSLPGSFVHGILQARILEWVATPFSSRSFQPRDRTHVFCTVGKVFTTWAPGQPEGRTGWGKIIMGWYEIICVKLLKTVKHDRI